MGELTFIRAGRVIEMREGHEDAGAAVKPASENLIRPGLVAAVSNK
jgi:hypothetical protein